MAERLQDHLRSITAATGSHAALCFVVIGPVAAIVGGSELLLFALLGKVPETALGAWSLMFSTAAAVWFSIWNFDEAARYRPRDLLRPVTASVGTWAVPFILAILNAVFWWSNGVEPALAHALTAWAAATVLISLPIASWQVLNHATSHAIRKQTSYYRLEGQAQSNEWELIAEIDDDVLELSRLQEEALLNGKWSDLRLTIEDRSRQVVQKRRQSNCWEPTNLLANGRPDDGVGHAV